MPRWKLLRELREALRLLGSVDPGLDAEAAPGTVTDPSDSMEHGVGLDDREWLLALLRPVADIQHRFAAQLESAAARTAHLASPYGRPTARALSFACGLGLR